MVSSVRSEVIQAAEGQEVRIEFFSRGGRRSILWILSREGALPLQTGDDEWLGALKRLVLRLRRLLKWGLNM